MIFNIPKTDIVIRQNVAALDDRRRGNRHKRRKARYGRQNVFDAIAGKLSPKQYREGMK